MDSLHANFESRLAGIEEDKVILRIYSLQKETPPDDKVWNVQQYDKTKSYINVKNLKLLFYYINKINIPIYFLFIGDFKTERVCKREIIIS